MRFGRTRSGHILGSNERISVTQALRAITIDAAWQHFQEADKGSLEPGKFADLVILSENPLAAAPGELAEIQVVATIVGGRTEFEARR